MKKLGLLAPLVLALPLAACAGSGDAPGGTSDNELRGLNKREALAELNQVGDAIRAFYGPLEYKKTRFNFDLDAALAAAKTEIEAATTEADRVRPFYELLAKLKDGHVSYSYPLKGDQTNETSIPMLVAPVEGAYVVAAASPALGVTRGDVLVSIDGITTQKLEELLLPISEIATPESSKHFAAYEMTFRPFYMPAELRPQTPKAHVVLKHADGSEYAIDAPWRTTAGGLAGQVQPPQPIAGENPVAPTDSTLCAKAAFALKQRVGPGEQASLLEFGALTPFFLSPAVKQQLGIVEVNPKAATLTSVGVTVPPTDATATDDQRFIQMRAYKYKFATKTVLLVRIPAFTVPQNNYDENVAWLGALLKDNMTPAAPGATLADTPADVVVLDDTHNPGGSVPYVTGLVSLFAKQPIPNIEQANHADRKWISRFLAAANQSDAAEQPIWLDRMKKVETALDTDKWLAPFSPIVGSFQGPTVPGSVELNVGADMLSPHALVHWNKPVLVLHDELSGSGGDVFPQLLQNGGVAKTFGARTMGLGGTVEPSATLPFSGAQLSLTRGLIGPYAASGDVKLIENNGVTPDYPYAHTVADFRAGFVGYAKAFSEVATRLQ